MRLIYLALFICVALCIFSPASAAYAEGAASMVTVTDIRMEPEILMYGDTGSLTITITNTGDSAVNIGRATLYGSDIPVLNTDSYDGGCTIAPDTSISYTFQVKADVPDGTFFQTFSVSFLSGGSLRYTLPIEVDSTGPTISVTSAPDTWAAGYKEAVTLCIGNTRANQINGIFIFPAGEGLISAQTGQFIGDLAPDESITATFEITPVNEEDIAFDISYRNGNNRHTATVTIPVTFGENKLAADLVVNGIEISSQGGSTVLSGDVTNAGLSDAYSVMVTVGDPAVPVNPNPVYVIGYLEPDDFSSFEVTFAGGSGTVPLIIEYKNAYGNAFTETYDISLNSAATVSDIGEASGNAPSGGANGMRGGFGSGISSVPFVEIGAGIIICAFAIVAWRKGWLDAVRDRLKKRTGR